MAEKWSGWEGEPGWKSVDADIDLAATSDGLGHVTLAVKFRAYVDEWSAAGVVHLDAGQLPELARKVRRLVQAV